MSYSPVALGSLLLAPPWQVPSSPHCSPGKGSPCAALTDGGGPLSPSLPDASALIWAGRGPAQPPCPLVSDCSAFGKQGHLSRHQGHWLMGRGHRHSDLAERPHSVVVPEGFLQRHVATPACAQTLLQPACGVSGGLCPLSLLGDWAAGFCSPASPSIVHQTWMGHF